MIPSAIEECPKCEAKMPAQRGCTVCQGAGYLYNGLPAWPVEKIKKPSKRKKH